MKFFNRAPREFTISVGKPWKINGEPTDATTPETALQAVYDQAVYFPIWITVEGPDMNYHLEMDEEGRTQISDSVSETAGQDESQQSAPIADPDEVNTSVDELISTPAEEDMEPAAIAAAIPDPVDDEETERGPGVLNKRTAVVAGIAIVAFALIGVIVTQFFGIGSDSEGAQASNSNTWTTELPTTAIADEPLDASYSSQLWTMEPGEADSLTWFAAGVVATDEGEIRLHSSLSGEEVAAYETDEEVQWAAEFRQDGEEAVGLRFEDTFVALTTEGQDQSWNVPEGMEVTVYGTTPLMTNATTEEDPEEITYQALQIGEEDPVELTVNPELATRAVDADWIVQPDPRDARVALNPVDRDDEDTIAHAVTLEAPTGEATFSRHLDAGHGHSLALWTVGEEEYLGIHPLEGDSAGVATTFVPAPFEADEATGWTIAAGMELGLIGPYAISLETGELAEYSRDQDFTRAYGPAAVTVDDNDRRTFAFENTEHHESETVIGFTGRGTILVRLTDGSVAAYGESEGEA